MFCFRARRLIHRFLDRQLPSQKAVLLETHLSRCAACNEELAQLLGLADQLQSSPTPDPPFAFAERTAAFALNRVLLRPSARLVWGSYWLPALAAACVMMTVAWTGFEMGRSLGDAFDGGIRTEVAGTDTLRISTADSVEPSAFVEEAGW